MELIELLTKNLGVREDQAKGGAGLLFHLVKEKLGDSDFSQVAQHVPGINDLIGAAPNPWGPENKPVILYQCPEMNRNETIFCYAAKGHPGISIKPDEIIVSYVANSTDFEKMAKDASLYRPRFLRVWFTKHSLDKPLK